MGEARDRTPLTIGARDASSDLEITDTRPARDGATLYVTVRDLMGTCRATGTPIKQMRRLARRAMPEPGLTRSSRLVRTFESGGATHATFAVSHEVTL